MQHWSPTTVEELESAVQACSVSETTFLDFKRFPERTDGGRKAIAADLAAFSIHGGTIVFGVDEPSDGVFSLDPAPLAGWREWVSQIGVNGVQPAITVRTRALFVDAESGYLVVDVAASPKAPHMARQRYYGRSDTTNRVLSDVEVRELWQRNLAQADRSQSILSDWIDSDPTPPELRNNAHLFVVAQPLSSDPELLLNAVPQRNLRPWVSALSLGGPYSPSAQVASSTARRAHGVARSSYEIGPDRVVRPNGELPARESSLWELEVREDGGMRLFNGRASDTSQGPAGIFGALVGGETSNIIEMARRISERCDFYGSWIFGIGIVGLRSQSAYNPNMLYDGDPYSDDTYTQLHEATRHDLSEAGSPVLDALIGRFCRSSLPLNQTPKDLDLYPITQATEAD